MQVGFLHSSFGASVHGDAGIRSLASISLSLLRRCRIFSMAGIMCAHALLAWLRYPDWQPVWFGFRCCLKLPEAYARCTCGEPAMGGMVLLGQVLVSADNLILAATTYAQPLRLSSSGAFPSFAGGCHALQACQTQGAIPALLGQRYGSAAVKKVNKDR